MKISGGKPAEYDPEDLV